MEATGRVVPGALALVDIHGQRHTLQRVGRGRHRLLLWLPRPSPTALSSWLMALEQSAPELTQREARALVLVPLENLASVAVAVGGVPWPVYGLPSQDRDRLQAVLGHSLPDAEPVLMVADRYGELFAVLDADAEPPALLAQALSWLDFIGLQCPE